MEHIPGVKKNNYSMSSRKLNLPLIIQGVHMFDDPFFFQPQYVECKQADVEQINNKVSKKLLF